MIIKLQVVRCTDYILLLFTIYIIYSNMKVALLLYCSYCVLREIRAKFSISGSLSAHFQKLVAWSFKNEIKVVQEKSSPPNQLQASAHVTMQLIDKVPLKNGIILSKI